MSKIGLQFQSGVVQDLGKLLAKKPIALKLIGNAVNLGIARTIKAQSPDTLIILRGAMDNWSLDAGVVDFCNRSMLAAQPFLNEGLCDFLEPPNEPVVQNDVNARRLNDQMVQCASLYKNNGFRPLAYAFSVGNPDYPLWAYLNDGILACDGWLDLHQYGVMPLSYDAANLALRHRTARTFMSSPVQSILKIIVGECFMDFGIGRPADGYPTQGGYRAMPQQGSDENYWIRTLTQQLDWWDGELAQDAYVIATTGYGFAMQEPWVGLGFDVANVDTDRAFYINWQQSGKAVIPPQGGSMEPTPAQTVANVPFLVKASLQAKYGPGGLGQPVYGEYEAVGDGNEKWPAWIFLRGGLKVKEGNYADFSGVKLFNPTSGEAMAEPLPWPDGGGGQPAAKRLTTADFASAGWPFEVTPCNPAAGQKFFGLVGYSDFKSGPQVGTETKCEVVDANGAILAGYKVTHAYNAANHASETFPSPTGFVLGPGSYIPNGAHPQDLFYVAKAGTPDGHADNWPDGYPSDIFRGGMPNGEHFEGRVWWQLMTG